MNFNHTSVYVDKGCFKNTLNQSLTMHSICGPQIFDNSISNWISECYFPAFLCLICLIYSSYIFGKLIYHLFKIEHNWLPHDEPSFMVKIIAISLPFFGLMTCILGLIYYSILSRVYTSMQIKYKMPKDLPPVDEYSNIYFIEYSLTVSVIPFGWLTWITGYIHVC